MTDLLKEIKLFKGISDDIQDDLLLLIIKETKQRVLAYANKGREKPLANVPEGIAFVVRDISIARFNKINNEGATANREEGQSFTWQTSYLEEYKDIIEDYWDRESTQLFSGGDGIARWI